jgi:hypothetical protein
MQAHLASLSDADLAAFYLSAGQSAFEDPGVEDDPDSPFYDSTTEVWFVVLDMIALEFERRCRVTVTEVHPNE